MGATTEAACHGACSLPGVLVTLWIIDRLGRKKTMALCFAVFSFCSLLLFICVGRCVVKCLRSWSGALWACGLWIIPPGGHLRDSLQPLTGTKAVGCLNTDQKLSFKVGEPHMGVGTGRHFDPGFIPILSHLHFRQHLPTTSC